MKSWSGWAEVPKNRRADTRKKIDNAAIAHRVGVHFLVESEDTDHVTFLFQVEGKDEQVVSFKQALAAAGIRTTSKE